jgi:hypothetical protein
LALTRKASQNADGIGTDLTFEEVPFPSAEIAFAAGWCLAAEDGTNARRFAIGMRRQCEGHVTRV